jgi:hypothetical protein
LPVRDSQACSVAKDRQGCLSHDAQCRKLIAAA